MQYMILYSKEVVKMVALRTQQVFVGGLFIAIKLQSSSKRACNGTSPTVKSYLYEYNGVETNLTDTPTAISHKLKVQGH